MDVGSISFDYFTQGGMAALREPHVRDESAAKVFEKFMLQQITKNINFGLAFDDLSSSASAWSDVIRQGVINDMLERQSLGLGRMHMGNDSVNAGVKHD